MTGGRVLRGGDTGRSGVIEERLLADRCRSHDAGSVVDWGDRVCAGCARWLGDLDTAGDLGECRIDSQCRRYRDVGSLCSMSTKPSCVARGAACSGDTSNREMITASTS